MKTSSKCAKTEELHNLAKIDRTVPVLNTEVLTHHTPDNLHALVSDIERYPEFIRWIKALRVSNIREDGPITTKLGEVAIGFKGFSERFSTNVSADANLKTVTATLVRGPFRRLKNVWRFSQLADGKTRVEFHLDYEFSNPILAMLARTNTKKAVSRIMQSFIEEADKRHGPAPTATLS